MALPSCTGFAPTHPQEACPLCPCPALGSHRRPGCGLGALFSAWRAFLLPSRDREVGSGGVAAGSSSRPTSRGAGRQQLSLDPLDVRELPRRFLEDARSLVSESPAFPRPQASLHLVLGNLLKCSS